MKGQLLYGLVVGALIFIPLERLFALHRQQKIFRNGWLTDVAHFLFTRALSNVAAFVFVGAAIILMHSFVSPTFQSAVASQNRVLQLLEAILIANLGGYLGHRLEHQIPFLWKFHSVHHSSSQMDWLAAARLHPLDQLVSKALTIVPLYLLGFSKATFGVYLGLATFHAVLIHANIRFQFGPLRWLITTPQFHHWHHSSDPKAYNKNFAGELPVIDLLFGTFLLPGGRMPQSYGVSEPVPNSYLRQLAYPFRRKAIATTAGPG